MCWQDEVVVPPAFTSCTIVSRPSEDDTFMNENQNSSYKSYPEIIKGETRALVSYFEKGLNNRLLVKWPSLWNAPSGNQKRDRRG